MKCVRCDVNAAINIRNRVDVTVLRQKLLKQRDNGSYEPKKLSKEKVKEELLSFRRCLMTKSGSERTKPNLISFDYV